MPVAFGRRAELGALVALCFFLPLYEAPKNLAWLAYALLWLANRWRARDFGGAARIHERGAARKESLEVNRRSARRRFEREVIDQASCADQSDPHPGRRSVATRHHLVDVADAVALIANDD
jgi:hypothetical protein